MGSFFSSLVSPEVRKAYADRRLQRSLPDAEKACNYLLSDACTSDLSDLLTGRFAFALPERVVRYDRNGKQRLIFRYPEKDRWLLSLIAWHLHIYDACFGANLYSHRLDKNVHSALLRIRTQPGIHEMHAYQTDVKSYGESIGLAPLQSALREFITDDAELLQFLCDFAAEDRYRENGEVFSGAPAVRQGCPLTGFFENVFLTRLDAELSQAADVYCRFNDDILFYAKNPEALEKCREILQNRFAQLGLRENTAKACSVAPGEFVRFVCFNVAGSRMDFSGNQVYLWERAAARLVREMLYLKRKYRFSDDMAMMLYIRSFADVRNRYVNLMPFITESRTLKLFDHLLLDAIRTVGNSGPGKKKYQISYARICGLGYQSLVHEYYERRKHSEK